MTDEARALAKDIIKRVFPLCLHERTGEPFDDDVAELAQALAAARAEERRNVFDEIIQHIEKDCFEPLDLATALNRQSLPTRLIDWCRQQGEQ